MTEFSAIQARLRKKILGMHFGANSGHIGCSLSCIDLMIGIIKYLKTPEDSFILSKGHAASALYAILNEMGEISDELLASFYKDATTLPAHPAPLKYPSISFATGSLGHGLPIATGIAKAMKLKNKSSFSFVLMSDGETNEGTTWESAHFAVANKLDNLFIIVDKNGLQGFDSTKNVLGDTASKNTWENIGFEVVEVGGHDIPDLVSAVRKFQEAGNGLPKFIIAETVKGKGIPYMENLMEWHYLPMNELQYREALDHIDVMYKTS